MIEIGQYLRAAMIADPLIAASITKWNGEPSVFTRLPVPDDASYPMIATPDDFARSDMDGLTSRRDVIYRDIFVYGTKGAPGAANDHTRIVQQMAGRLRDMFHRKRESLGNTPFHVIDIVVSGPRTAPTDDDNTVGRVVTLTVRVQP